MALILKRERWKQEADLFVVGPGIEQEQQFALRFNPLMTMKTQVGNAEEVICTKERQEIQDLLSEQLSESLVRNLVSLKVITLITLMKAFQQTSPGYRTSLLQFVVDRLQFPSISANLLSVREVMPDSHDQRNNVVKSVITRNHRNQLSSAATPAVNRLEQFSPHWADYNDYGDYIHERISPNGSHKNLILSRQVLQCNILQQRKRFSLRRKMCKVLKFTELITRSA